jgi:hypothetical protein
MKLTPLRILCATMVVVTLCLAGSGRLAPVLTNDTSGYLAPWTWSEGFWGDRRTPVLGFLLAPFNEDFTMFPTIVVGLFFVAVYFLYRSLLLYGVSERAALALTLPLVISNSLVVYSREVHAEVPSIILLLFALGLLFRLEQMDSRNFWRYLGYACTLGAAYVMRPSFLPFVIFMPVLFAAIGYLKTKRWQTGASAVILLLSIGPFLTVSTIRYYAVDDFNTVSFGGFNMTSIASVMLSEELIGKLENDHQRLARDILEKRDAMVRGGEIYGMVRVAGERSFRTTARGYFDILEINSDQLLHKVVYAERRPGESWVQFNRRMMAFCLDVVRVAPMDYAMWVVGGVRSATGSAIAQNIPFALTLGALLAVYSCLLFTGRLPILRFAPLDVPVLVLVTVVFVFGAGVLSVITTFPAKRYVFTSALFLPSLLFYLLIHLCAESRLPTAEKET